MIKKYTKYLRKCYEAPKPEAPQPIFNDIDRLKADLALYRKELKRKPVIEKLPAVPTAMQITEGVLRREQRRLIGKKNRLNFPGSPFLTDVQKINNEIKGIMKNLDRLLRD